MKRTLFILTSIFIVAISVIAVSCSKEDNDITKKGEESLMYEPVVNDGVLTFSTTEEMSNLANYLYEKGVKYIQEWDKKNDFMSQESLYQKILEAEDEFDAVYYKDIDEDISVNQLTKMGLGIKHSELYEKYKNLGFIREIVEEDGSVSFEPNVPNPAIMNVVDEDGFVLIDKHLHQFVGSKIKFTEVNDVSKISVARKKLLSQEVTNKEMNVVVMDLSESDLTLKGIGTTTKHIVGEDWIYRGKKLRCKVMYTIYDSEADEGTPIPSNYSSNCMNITHYYFATGQEKRWGKWKTRNSYWPIQQTDGSWTVCVHFLNGPTDCTWSQSGTGLVNSPYHQDYSFVGGSSNYTKVNCSPTGWICGDYYYGIESLHYNWSTIVRGYGTIIHTK